MVEDDRKALITEAKAEESLGLNKHRNKPFILILVKSSKQSLDVNTKLPLVYQTY